MMTKMAWGQSQSGTVPNVEGIDYEAYSLKKLNIMLPSTTFTSLVFKPETYDGSFSPEDLGVHNVTPGGWTFTTAPESVDWSINAKVGRVDIFGTNRPPVVSGTKGMRDLSLSNSLIEGFSRNKTVEFKIQQLEELMNYSLNTKAGYVNVPVYQVKANDKAYGNLDGGYFVLSDVSVKEKMRDLRGNTTRAYVDVKFIQVPSYQVDSGRDQASSAINTGVRSASAQANQGVGITVPSSGPNSVGAKAASLRLGGQSFTASALKRSLL